MNFQEFDEALGSSTPARPPRANWIRLEYDLALITPMMGGGVRKGEPDLAMPIRASAIRGHLRFWWRLLARSGRWPDALDRTKPDGVALYEAETLRFGGLTKNAQASAIRLTVKGPESQPELTKFDDTEEVVKAGDWRRAVVVNDQFTKLAYGMYAARGQIEVHQGARELKSAPQKIVAASAQITVTLTLDLAPQFRGEFELVMRWWAAFGGVGARTRRGFGALCVKRNNIELSRPPDDEILAAGCQLFLNPKLLSTAKLAHIEAVEKLKRFRQGPDGRNGQMGRSFWPEANSIRMIAGTWRVKAGGISFAPPSNFKPVFPRAAFGLPIEFRFKNQFADDARGDVLRDDAPCDPETATLKPATLGSERMASPLILRPIAAANGRYQAGALLMPSGHLSDLKVAVTGKLNDKCRAKPSTFSGTHQYWGNTTTLRRDQIDKLAIAPFDTKTHLTGIRPLKGYSADQPLLIFCAYFVKST